MLREVGAGEHGEAPASIVVLSGDVDLATVPVLRDVLLRATLEHPGQVVAVDSMTWSAESGQVWANAS